jgi:hypothetical protein
MLDRDPEQWGALDEDQRIELVVEYHREARIVLPDEHIHALMHVIIENQIALGDKTPVAGTIRRLLNEGLDRHDAIHAIASVLVNFMFERTHGADDGRGNDVYYAELKQLTADKWTRGEYKDPAGSSRE